MNKVFLILVLFIFLPYAYMIIINRKKRSDLMKAGKRWEVIVKELSRRK